MTTYAAKTDVSAERSRGEIERTLIRYGASSFSYGWDQGRAGLEFLMRDRRVRFILPLPDREDRQFTHTPGRGQKRTPEGAMKEWDQAVKSRWRSLALVVKAKLEAVEAGIVTFEEEFGMHMVMPDGRTVAQHVVPAVDHAYLTGTVRPLIAIEE